MMPSRVIGAPALVATPPATAIERLVGRVRAAAAAPGLMKPLHRSSDVDKG
jgi:hypothetical protein